MSGYLPEPEQSDEIMRTDDTRRCWPLIELLDPEPLVPEALDPEPDVPDAVEPEPVVPLVLPEPLVPDVLPELPEPLADVSIVPVTSTLWPTCCFSSVSRPSSM